MSAEIAAAVLARALMAERTRVFCASDGAYWAVIRPPVNVDNKDEVMAKTEDALAKMAEYDGNYRFALAGIEVDEARSWDEIQDDVRDGVSLTDLVLSDSAYVELNRPREFAPFGKGWRATGRHA